LGALLKALGMTIWGLIAFGLLAIFIFVGYEAAMRFRSSATPLAETHSPSIQSTPASIRNDPTNEVIPESKPASKPISAAQTRVHFREAAELHQYGATVEFGKQLVDSGSASPDDFVIIAHAFYSINDCASALTWADRASGAFQAAEKEPEESLLRIKRRCGPDTHGENAPRLITEVKKNESGELDVRRGELFYGFGDYEHAILAIQRGLQKGGITHLDDAYIYLGLSQLAVKNPDQACKAFDQLRDVPNISPRTLRLWELFADTRC
jgi:tetratricopeptide (TPR) repeat protein